MVLAADASPSVLGLPGLQMPAWLERESSSKNMS